jgi:hypothetical protein
MLRATGVRFMHGDRRRADLMHRREEV